ncbi:MAG: Nif11-like leader peptide family natural product precursor [Oscillospiraceae bacterium]|nr:Nif11-like leader peptide family natural product precursor [Oscillospiraceae bacterium]
MNEERIKEVFSDEEFVKELFSKETPEEAQALLAEKEIDMSIDELVKLKDLVAAKLQAAENGESTEITEEDLADVAGGVAVLFAIMGLVVVGVGMMMAIPYIDFERRW